VVKRKSKPATKVATRRPRKENKAGRKKQPTQPKRSLPPKRTRPGNQQVENEPKRVRIAVTPVETFPSSEIDVDEPEVLTRDQRKLRDLMQTFQKIEDRQSRKRPNVVAVPRTPKNNQGDLEPSVTPRQARAKNRSLKTPSERSIRSRLRRVGRRTNTFRAGRTEAEIETARDNFVWTKRLSNPLTPMYLGRKEWLLTAYREMHSKQHTNFRERALDNSVGPFYKRVLQNYQVEQLHTSSQNTDKRKRKANVSGSEKIRKKKSL
jgi:hypothetical protein